MVNWTRARGAPLALLVLLAGCKNKNTTTDETEDTALPTGNTTSVPGFAIDGVEAWTADMADVADVVQLPTGEVAAVGLDLAGRGAIHLVTASAVTTLHAGYPLGNPTSVDLGADGTLYVTDLGGANPDAEQVATANLDEYPTGGLFSLPSSGGTPTLVTRSILFPQGVVVAHGGIVYATGFTEALVPAVFSVENGAVSVLAQGAPLVRPGDISVVGDPDATQLWVIDVSGGEPGVAHGGANLVAVIPPSTTVVEVADGMTAIGVTGRGPDALVVNQDATGMGRVQIVDVNDGSRREVAGVTLSTPATGAGAGADPTLPVLAGGSSGEVFVTRTL